MVPTYATKATPSRPTPITFVNMLSSPSCRDCVQRPSNADAFHHRSTPTTDEQTDEKARGVDSLTQPDAQQNMPCDVRLGMEAKAAGRGQPGSAKVGREQLGYDACFGMLDLRAFPPGRGAMVVTTATTTVRATGPLRACVLDTGFRTAAVFDLGRRLAEGAAGLARNSRRIRALAAAARRADEAAPPRRQSHQHNLNQGDCPLGPHGDAHGQEPSRKASSHSIGSLQFLVNSLCRT
jgi:hypothetical protein